MAGIPDGSLRSAEFSGRMLEMEKEEKKVVLAASEAVEQQMAEERMDWQNAGSVREYLDAVGEQIENPHARCAIRREIGNHIEEQTESYLREGMTPLTAAQEAVRQMGDPVETGRELNRIHRPQFPTILFGITIALTLMGIVMQGILFSHMETAGTENYLRNTILYNGIGLLLILGLLYGNYMKLVRFSYGLTVLFIAAGLASGILGPHIGSSSYHDRYELIYRLWMLFPVLYAMLLYRMRNLGWKAILILDVVYLVMVPLLSQDTSCVVGMMEAFLLSTAILFLAIGRGILSGKKRAQYLVAAGLPAAGLLFFLVRMVGSGYATYQMDRIRHMLLILMGKGVAEENYIARNIRQEQHGFSLLGGGKISEALLFTSDENAGVWLLSQESSTTYIIHSIFLWFGIIVGGLVIVALFAFAFYALRISLRQSNRAALLLGSMCSLSILLRIFNAVLVNFGFGIYYTVSIPFLAFGLGNCLVNSLMVGVILCVFRNSNVMMGELEKSFNVQSANTERKETKTES